MFWWRKTKIWKKKFNRRKTRELINDYVSVTGRTYYILRDMRTHMLRLSRPRSTQRRRIEAIIRDKVSNKSTPLTLSEAVHDFTSYIFTCLPWNTTNMNIWCEIVCFNNMPGKMSTCDAASRLKAEPVTSLLGKQSPNDVNYSYIMCYWISDPSQQTSGVRASAPARLCVHVRVRGL